MKLVILFGIIALAQVSNGSGPRCSRPTTNQRNQKKMEELRKISKDHCVDYGQDSSDVNAEKKETLSTHRVCTDPDEELQKRFVEATITADNLDTGTPVNNDARKRLKPFFRRCNADHCGHIIGNELGGFGLDWNLFPQAASLNLGHWKTVTNRVTKHLRAEQKEEIHNYKLPQKSDGTRDGLIQVSHRQATIQMAFEFADALLYARPSKYYYQIDLFTDEHQETTIYGKFTNCDHTETELKSCRGDGNTEQYFVYAELENVERHKGRQTCDVEDAYKKYFPRPS